MSAERFTTPSHLRAYAMAAALHERGMDLPAVTELDEARRMRTSDWLAVLERQLEASGAIVPGELDARIVRPDRPWEVHP
jgi:hypothetical protein